MMSNPDMLRSMMDNPLVTQLMGNPDVMRQLITSNPQMRELMEVSNTGCIYLDIIIRTYIKPGLEMPKNTE